MSRHAKPMMCPFPFSFSSSSSNVFAMRTGLKGIPSVAPPALSPPTPQNPFPNQLPNLLSSIHMRTGTVKQSPVLPFNSSLLCVQPGGDFQYFAPSYYIFSDQSCRSVIQHIKPCRNTVEQGVKENRKTNQCIFPPLLCCRGPRRLAMII